jgi:hypothetical protein
MRELLRRVFLVDLFKGMWVTFRYQAPKNIYTEQYPIPRNGRWWRSAIAARRG